MILIPVPKILTPGADVLSPTGDGSQLSGLTVAQVAGAQVDLGATPAQYEMMLAVSRVLNRNNFGGF